MFLKSEGVSNLTPAVPSVQHFFSGVVIHHGVVGVLVCELYVGVPLSFCLGVVSKVDGSGPGAITVDTVDHSTGHKSIAHRAHWLYAKTKRYTHFPAQLDAVTLLLRWGNEILFIKKKKEKRSGSVERSHSRCEKEL